MKKRPMRTKLFVCDSILLKRDIRNGKSYSDGRASLIKSEETSLRTLVGIEIRKFAVLYLECRSVLVLM
jgi:hypothetical protein